MPDNRPADRPSPYTLASDDVASVWYDIVKLAFGALDTATLVSSAAGLPVNVVAGATNTEYTEDAAAVADPIGGVLILVRRDTPSATEVSADGDNIAAKAASTGAQYVELLAGVAKIGGDATNGLDVDVTRMPVDANAAEVQGTVAHDAVDAQGPVKIGGRASGLPFAAVATDDRVDAYFDRHGRQFIRHAAQADPTNGWELDEAPAANTQATETRAAGAAGVRHVATGIQATLASNGTAPTAIQLDLVLRDGAAGAGAIIWECSLSISATAGVVNGIVVTGLWMPGTAATAMTLEFGAAGGANTFESINLQGVDITE